MSFGFTWSDGLAMMIMSFWVFIIFKKFVSIFYTARPKNGMKEVLIFILILVPRLLFYITEYNFFPLVLMLSLLVSNILVVYLLGKGSSMSILAGATFFAAMEVSLDVLVFFGLNLLIPQNYLWDAYFYIFVILVYPLAYLFLILASKHEEEKLRRNRKKFQFILLFSIALVRVVANIFIMNTPEIFWGREISNDIFVALMVLLFVAILGENEVSKMSYQKKMRDIEYKALRRHMEDTERQTMELQKFKHDYRNILMSLEWHILKGDHSALMDYFNTRIKQIPKSWDDEDKIFEVLNRIDEKEIRSILRMKIQRMISLNMQVEIEQVDEINSINIDPIVMVRTIGILLDNAMEEVEHLEEGIIKIAFRKEKKGVVFHVSNNCRENHCNLENIKEKAFTTKGEGRGIGLQILADFSEEYKNFLIETKIVDNWFTQIVTIDG